ncbi:uncharacterized protein [Pyxicephalus adspersus]
MIRPGAACPYLRTDAVPAPLFIQRKKKIKRKRGAKQDENSTPGTNEEEEEPQGDSHGSDHQMENMVKPEVALPSRETQEPQTQVQSLAVEPQNRERTDEPLEQGAEMGKTQEKGPEVQTQAAETQSFEQIEILHPSTAGQPLNQLVEMLGEQMAGVRMAENDVNVITQSEQQVALILAALEDTHCEMRAAEAAREAASNHTPADKMADCSDLQSSEENLANYIPFEHAYTSLTMSDKENNVPPLTSSPDSTPSPSPVTNPKLVKLRKKIKALQKQVLRQGVKVKILKQTLVDMRRNNLSEKDPERVISQHCSGLALALFTTQLKNHRKYSAMQYCNLLKDFALNLYQASPKAYKFCRLFLSLPHPVSLRHWKTANDASQGAVQEVIMQVEQGQDPQGEAAQEDILAGALKAVELQTDSQQEEISQNEALSGTELQ